MSGAYEEFLASKSTRVRPVGFEPVGMNPAMRPFQADTTSWACRKGRAALFKDCGLGKTIDELEFSRQVAMKTGGSILVLAPLAVAHQHMREAQKFGYEATLCRKQQDVRAGINITNYEMLHAFDASKFAGVVLDESSILKSYDGATRIAIVDAFRRTPYKLACTATPAPNDYMELGNHAEFLGVMSRVEMLSMFFTHDGGETQKWRLKGHAQAAFWRWVCDWAVMMRRPSDLGYEDEGFALPPLEIEQVQVKADTEVVRDAGLLFALEARTLSERREARKASMGARVRRCLEMVAELPSNEPCLIWCDYNAEQDELEEAFGSKAFSVQGSDTLEDKEDRVARWCAGERPVMISKVACLGFGLNFQHASEMIFCGLSDSYEKFYQAVRREWRFGQTKRVRVRVVTSTLEAAVVRNIEAKEASAQAMVDAMIGQMSSLTRADLKGTETQTMEHKQRVEGGDGWEMCLGDCVEGMREVASESIDYSIFSPPFSSLYTYSNSPRDMGNCADHGEFFEHFRFLVADLFRVTKPGRLLSVHCMLLPTSKTRDGVIGLVDFRGDLIRAFAAAGFIYHSETVIWKDPVTAMQRTKALGLLHKQIRKDSSMSRQGIPDYLVTMRKPGVNAAPISHTAEEFPVSEWQGLASPIWMDIDPNDTLQFRSARENDDEKHICPLQLEVIRRALRLWTNPGDLVLSPFAGIGSEGYVALENERRFKGFELKESYFKQAVGNLNQARRQSSLFPFLSEVKS